MGIDISIETPITLAKAARTLPGGAVHVSTIHRWRKRGVRNVRLETFLRGGVRYTTPEAIARFFGVLTKSSQGSLTNTAIMRAKPRIRNPTCSRPSSTIIETHTDHFNPDLSHILLTAPL